MPSKLDNLTRREFLRRGLFAAGVLSLTPSVAFGEEEGAKIILSTSHDNPHMTYVRSLDPITGDVKTISKGKANTTIKALVSPAGDKYAESTEKAVFIRDFQSSGTLDMLVNQAPMKGTESEFWFDSDDFSWSHDGESIFFGGAFDGRNISVYSIKEKSLFGLTYEGQKTNNHDVAISPSGRIAYVHHEYETHYYIRLVNEPEKGQYPQVPNNRRSVTALYDAIGQGYNRDLLLTWLDDSRLMWYAPGKIEGGMYRNRFYLLDTSDSKNKPEILTSAPPINIYLPRVNFVFSPDKKEILWIGRRPEDYYFFHKRNAPKTDIKVSVASVEVLWDTKTEIRETTLTSNRLGFLAYDPMNEASCWSPDGRYIALSDSMTQKVNIYSSKNLALLRSYPLNSQLNSPVETNFILWGGKEQKEIKAKP